jgi:response regulator of citrate/malate metabolism
MYKVLIVEDEVTILEGLQLIVDWGKYGFKIIGLCENGEKAVDVCRQDTPDVIITDIRMPGLSGLDLINKLGGRDSGIKYVILSGYDDFMYAQKAIEYGVESYILKPIDEKELINLLIDLKIKLDNEKDKVLEQQVLKERLNCVSNISSKSLLNKLFTKGYDYMNDVEKKILSEIFTGPFFLTLIKIDKYFKESNIYGFKNDESLKDVEDIISRCIGENYFPLDIGFYVWVGSSVNKNKIVNIFPKMLADVKQHTSNTVSVYTSKSFSDFEDAKAVFERAKAGFSKLYFTGEIGKCYDYFMDNSGGKNNYRELTDCVSNIISYFQMPDVRELEEHLNKLGYLCKQSTSSETEIKNLFVKIFSQVFIILTNNYKIEPNLVLSSIEIQ